MEIEVRNAKRQRKLQRKVSRALKGVQIQLAVDTLFSVLLAGIKQMGKCTSEEAAACLRDNAEEVRAFEGGDACKSTIN